MLIKLVEVKRGMRGGSAFLNEIYINSSHIISVSEDSNANQSLINEIRDLGLVEGIRFSKVVLSEGHQTRSVTIVGTPSEIYNKMKNKQILRG
jgi:O-phosphoseryl-tRNA(Cys) synthetase